MISGGLERQRKAIHCINLLNDLLGFLRLPATAGKWPFD